MSDLDEEEEEEERLEAEAEDLEACMRDASLGSVWETYTQRDIFLLLEDMPGRACGNRHVVALVLCGDHWFGGASGVVVELEPEDFNELERVVL